MVAVSTPSILSIRRVSAGFGVEKIMSIYQVVQETGEGPSVQQGAQYISWEKKENVTVQNWCEPQGQREASQTASQEYERLVLQCDLILRI